MSFFLYNPESNYCCPHTAFLLGCPLEHMHLIRAHTSLKKNDPFFPDPYQLPVVSSLARGGASESNTYTCWSLAGLIPCKSWVGSPSCCAFLNAPALFKSKRQFSAARHNIWLLGYSCSLFYIGPQALGKRVVI